MSQNQSQQHPLDKLVGACRFCKEPSEIISYTCGWCGCTRYFLLTPIELPESEDTELTMPVTLPEQAAALAYE